MSQDCERIELNRVERYLLIGSFALFVLGVILLLLSWLRGLSLFGPIMNLVACACCISGVAIAYRAQPKCVRTDDNGLEIVFGARTRSFAWTDEVTVLVRKAFPGHALCIQIPGEKKPVDVSLYSKRKVTEIRQAILKYAPAESPFHKAFA